MTQDQGLTPGKAAPKADVNGLRYTGDGFFYTYAHATHSEADLLRPGYFDPIIGRNFLAFHGGLILCTAKAGQPNPEDWSTLLLRIARVSGHAGHGPDEPTVVAVVERFGKAELAAKGGA